MVTIGCSLLTGALLVAGNVWRLSVKVGDLVLDPFGDTAILLSEPRLSEDCMPGGKYYPDATYYEAAVLVAGCEDVWITDDVEVISESR